MPKLSASDIAELREFQNTTESIALGGESKSNAIRVSTGHNIFYYVIDTGPNHEMFWIGVQDKIRRDKEWAIIHDHNSGRYELWTDGTKFRTLDEHEVFEELARCIAVVPPLQATDLPPGPPWIPSPARPTSHSSSRTPAVLMLLGGLLLLVTAVRLPSELKDDTTAALPVSDELCVGRPCRANSDPSPARGYEVPTIAVEQADP
ncbi:MAG: hypothetical protein ACRDRT_16965, partial [Pseudonocardiaceae bacterium]